MPRRRGHARCVGQSATKLSGDEIADGIRLTQDGYAQRRVPKTRSECVDGDRPCLAFRCRYHLGTDITPAGNVIDIVGDRDPNDLETCALDVAASGEHTLEEVGAILMLTRERVRQIENTAMFRFRRAAAELGLDLEEALRYVLAHKRVSALTTAQAEGEAPEWSTITQIRERCTEYLKDKPTFFGGAMAKTSMYAELTGKAKRAIDEAIRDASVTPRQTFERLEELGVGDISLGGLASYIYGQRKRLEAEAEAAEVQEVEPEPPGTQPEILALTRVQPQYVDFGYIVRPNGEIVVATLEEAIEASRRLRNGG